MERDRGCWPAWRKRACLTWCPASSGSWPASSRRWSCASTRSTPRSWPGTRPSPVSQRLATVPGIGPLVATAIAATLPDPTVFRSGREFAAWLGLVPRQNSTGGKTRLGRTSRQGNAYIRRLLVIGAQSALLCSKATKANPWVQAAARPSGRGSWWPLPWPTRWRGSPGPLMARQTTYRAAAAA